MEKIHEPLIEVNESDINRDMARDAYRHTAFNPEKRGDLRICEYVEFMTAVVAEFEAFVTDENRDEMIVALNEFKQGHLKGLRYYLIAHSAVASTMITGPSNFPVARNRKRSDIADRRMIEWIEWTNKRLAKMRQRFNPRMIANAPIRLDDGDAVQKLQGKIEKLEDRQEFMKAVNKVCRNKKFDDDQKRVELAKIIKSESLIDEILTPNYMNQIGFESFMLTNNNAEIRRLNGRLIEAKRERERQPAEDREIAPGVFVIENETETRLQIVFPDKPSDDIRALLKRNGFIWAPSQNAWQRLLNANGRSALRQIENRLIELIGVEG